MSKRANGDHPVALPDRWLGASSPETPIDDSLHDNAVDSASPVRGRAPAVDSIEPVEPVDPVEPVEPRASAPSTERVEHFFVMLGQLLDGALIGGMFVRLTLSDGSVLEGIPLTPASDPTRDDQLDDTGVVRCIELSGASVDLADVRQAAIVHPV